MKLETTNGPMIEPIPINIPNVALADTISFGCKKSLVCATVSEYIGRQAIEKRPVISRNRGNGIKFAKIKTTAYLETNENRLKREKELGFKFSSFRYVGFTSPELPNMGGTEYFYEYQFDLGKSTYGKEYPDDDNPDLPPNTKIILTGNLYLDSEFNIVSTSDGMTYSLSLCDCLTKSEFSNVGACEIKFYDRYGTISPSSEQMEKDYFDCK